MVYKYDLEIK